LGHPSAYVSSVAIVFYKKRENNKAKFERLFCAKPLQFSSPCSGETKIQSSMRLLSSKRETLIISGEELYSENRRCILIFQRVLRIMLMSR